MKYYKILILIVFVLYCSSSPEKTETEIDTKKVETPENNTSVPPPKKEEPEKKVETEKRAKAETVEIVIKEDKIQDVKDYNSAGMKYFSKKDYKSSLRYYVKHKEEQEKKGMIGTNGYATTLHNIGMVYSRMGENDLALEHYTRSMAVMDSIGLQKTSDYATTLFNVGKLFYKNYKKPCEAVHWLKKAVELEEKLDHPDLAKDKKYYMQVDGECED